MANSSAVTYNTNRSVRTSLPPEMDAGTHLPIQHGFKTTPVFLQADKEAFWSLLPNKVSCIVRRHNLTRDSMFLQPRLKN